jgi:hypothetical protein
MAPQTGIQMAPPKEIQKEILSVGNWADCLWLEKQMVKYSASKKEIQMERKEPPTRIWSSSISNLYHPVRSQQ